MKKIFYRLFILFSILSFGIYTFSFCDDIDDEIIDVNAEIISSNNFKSQIKLPDTNSRACVVIDRNTNTILYGKNDELLSDNYFAMNDMMGTLEEIYAGHVQPEYMADFVKENMDLMKEAGMFEE